LAAPFAAAPAPIAFYFYLFYQSLRFINFSIKRILLKSRHKQCGQKRKAQTGPDVAMPEKLDRDIRPMT